MSDSFEMETSSEIMEDTRIEEESAPPECTAPWLLLQQGKDFEDQTFYVLSPLPSHDQYYETKCIPEFYENSVIGCRYGWLLLTDIFDGELCLLNAFTLDTVLLPALEYEFNIIPLYALTAPPDDLNCVVILFHKNRAIFCRPGRRDKCWTVQETRIEGSGKEIKIEDIVSCNGAIYAIGVSECESLLFSVDIVDDDQPVAILLMTFRSLVPACPFAFSCAFRLSNFLVESCGELFIVGYWVNYGDIHRVEVYRLDKDTSSGNKMTWTEVKNLKNRAFFIGRSCSASLWLKSHESLGLVRENSIYITFRGDDGFYRYGLEDRSLTPFLPCPNLPEDVKNTRFWVVPSTCHQSINFDKKLGEDEYYNYCINSIDKGIIQSRVMSCTSILKKDVEDDECGTNQSVFSALPLHIISLLATRLPLSDYLRFRAVCKRFLKAAPGIDWITTSIMSKREDHTDFRSSLLFLDRTDGMLCNLIDLSPEDHDLCWSCTGPAFLKRATVALSSKGWLLLVSDAGILQSFNPITGSVVEYPQTLVQGVIWGFSTFPTSPDCVIFGMEADGFRFVCIHRGDEDWTYYESAKKASFATTDNTPVYYKGAFYILDRNGLLGAFELNKDGGYWNVVIEESPCREPSQETYLVECDGTLLSIFVGSFGRWILVFKLHRPTMTWEKLQSLGKHMLFLGPVSSFSRPAISAEMENRIYFLRFLGGSALYYSLDTGKYYSDGTDHPVNDFCNSKQLLQSCWIQPTQP